jgi:hypothetical protein
MLSRTYRNPAEIPYVQVQEESMERNMIGIKLANGTKISVTEIHSTANKELFLSFDRWRQGDARHGTCNQSKEV